MASKNLVILIGNCGNDPEVRYTTSGKATASFRLATSEKFKNSAGDREERTEWHNIVLWGKPAEIAGQYLKKGKQCSIQGRLQTRKWQDNNKQDRYTTEIIADELLLLSGKNSDTTAQA